MGRHLCELVPRDSRDTLRSCVAEVLRSGQPGRCELAGESHGQRRVFDVRVGPVPGPQGIDALVCTSTDITERRRTESQLAHIDALLQAVLEQSPVPIVVASGDGLVEFVNAACLEQLGVVDEPRVRPGATLSSMNRTWQDLDEHGRPVPDEDLPLVRALAGETTRGRKMRVRRKDGTERFHVVHAAPIRDTRGELIAGLVLFPDVTEWHRSDEERRKLEEQLRKAQKLESLAVLAGGIAHDFNNLLMGILGNADLALRGESPPARELLEDIETAARRASGLAQQMLAYAGRGRLATEELSLEQLVRGSIERLEAEVSGAARLELDLAKDAPPVEADPLQIEQILLELVANAHDALSGEPGRIRICTGSRRCDRDELAATYLDDGLEAGRYVTLEVSDDGCGMSHETQARIFDPFFTTKFTGRGLGLAAVLGIVRAHRGALRVESEPDHGTTIQILLPSRPGLTPVPASSPAPSGEHPALRGLRLLVVDDEATVRTVSRRLLSHLGVEAVLASSGRQAVELLDGAVVPFDGVILDLTMPGMQGDECFRKLRALDPELPVLLSSGYDEEEMVARLLEQGLAGFLRKPYGLAQLANALAPLKRRGRTSS